MSWKKYYFSTLSEMVPIGNQQVEMPENLPEDVDSDDEELTCARLTEEWEDHPAGSRVIVGLTVEDHPFWVEERKEKEKERVISKIQKVIGTFEWDWTMDFYSEKEEKEYYLSSRPEKNDEIPEDVREEAEEYADMVEKSARKIDRLLKESIEYIKEKDFHNAWLSANGASSEEFRYGDNPSTGHIPNMIVELEMEENKN